MQVVSHHRHQYLCSACGSVLKETVEYIEILPSREQCPNCGSMLAESLIRKALGHEEVTISPLPKIQTADTLLLQLKKKLRFDIPKIDSFIRLASTDLCCISGYDANLLLTRLCVRSLLPERYGGLNSPFVAVADAGNHTDVYSAVNFARQYGMSKENVAERILVVRAFTVHQVRRLISVELPEIIQKYHIRGVIVPSLLNAFDEDPNMKMKDAKKEISKITQAINELSTKVLVVTSIQQGGRFSDPVLCGFKKRINLVQEEEGKKYSTLKAEIYNLGDSKIVNLTERELKMIPKSSYNFLSISNPMKV
jgi:ribosomal protein S27AE